MALSNRLKKIAVSGSLLSALIVAGCADQGATSLTSSAKPAPPPSNLTPEQKKAYDEGVKNAGPPMADAK